MTLYGRVFEIIGCDIFTQAYYKENFQIDFPLSKLCRPYPPDPPPRIVPPHTGFGRAEDSILNVKHLVYQLKHPEQDFFKQMDN